MPDSELIIVEPQREARALDRRTILRGGAWAVPAVVVVSASPFAAATTPPINSNVVLSFAGTHFSTYDITLQVVDFIVDQVSGLGPAYPPGEPRQPVRSDFPPGTAGTIQYNAARLAWGVAYGAWAIENAEALALYHGWQLAVGELRKVLVQFADLGRLVFEVEVTYPRQLIATNAGPNAIDTGSVLDTTIVVDSSYVRSNLVSISGIPIIGGINNTGSITTFQTQASTPVPVGGQVYSADLAYNPVAVTLNIGGSTESSNVTASITGDNNPAGNLINSNLGVTLNVVSQGWSAVTDQWEEITESLEDLREIYELLRPFIESIDWASIIRGLLPISTP